MKVEIAGHRCCFGNRSAGEVVGGSVATAFEVEISLRGVNGAVKGAVAGETDGGVTGQAIISEVFCLGSIVGDAVAADGRGARVVPNCAEFWRGSLAAADLLKKPGSTNCIQLKHMHPGRKTADGGASAVRLAERPARFGV